MTWAAVTFPLWIERCWVLKHLAAKVHLLPLFKSLITRNFGWCYLWSWDPTINHNSGGYSLILKYLLGNILEWQVSVDLLPSVGLLDCPGPEELQKKNLFLLQIHKLWKISPLSCISPTITEQPGQLPGLNIDVHTHKDTHTMMTQRQGWAGTNPSLSTQNSPKDKMLCLKLHYAAMRRIFK